MSDKQKMKETGKKVLNGIDKTLDIISSGFELFEAIIGVADSVNNAKYSADNFKNNFSNNKNEVGD